MTHKTVRRPRSTIDSPVHYMTGTEIEIMNYIGARKRCPSFREIAREIDKSYTATAYSINCLIDRGYLTIEIGSNGIAGSRTLRLATE